MDGDHAVSHIQWERETEGADRIPNPLFTQRCTGVVAFVTSFNLHMILVVLLSMSTASPKLAQISQHIVHCLCFTSRHHASATVVSVISFRGQRVCFPQGRLCISACPLVYLV